jgi:hypothetical protein
MPAATTGDTITPQAALERLAAALDPRDYSTTLVAGQGQPPRLAVARFLSQTVWHGHNTGRGGEAPA